MASVETPVCDFGAAVPHFELPDTAGTLWTPQSARGEKGLLVMFICNHCPYVKAIRPRLVRDVRALMELGMGAVAILSNDPNQYAEDSPENMARVAAEFDFPFPYLLDADQSVAKAFAAVCTPDFFGYNADLALQYRGRFDASRKETAPEGVRRDLFEGLREVIATGRGPAEQIPSMGCSIKWIDER